MKIVLFADTHLGFDYPRRPRVHRRRRGPDFFDSYHRVLEYAAQNRPDLVVHGGDFFFRSRVPQKIVEMAYEPLFNLARTGIPIVLVPGNHERSKLPASLWLAHPNIHVFDRPRTFPIEASGRTIAVSGFPFARDVGGRFRALLAEAGWASSRADIRLLCMHQAVESSQAGTC
jgi:exonuclease SbcD